MSDSSASGGLVVPLNARPEPKARRQLISNGVMGMLLFVVTEVMVFSGFISAFVILKSKAVVWPPPGQPRLPFEATAINTTALLVSGVVLVLAELAYRKEPRAAAGRLTVCILLGLFFVGFQGMEWMQLIGQGLTLTSSALGSFFYLIIGLHAIHAVLALGAMGWALRRLRQGRLTRSEFGTVQTFWYFVVLLWPFLYFNVYL